MKKRLSENVELDVSKLDYNRKFLDFIISKKNDGHQLFLATACDRSYAEKVADSLKIFDGVFSSDGVSNLRASAKAYALVTIFGDRGFIYAGNSKDDLDVWEKSDSCILVNPSKSILKKIKNKKYVLFD